jgi:hypothetical protein
MSSGFINKITQRESAGEKIKNELQNSNLPLVLWGNSNIAELVYNWLTKNNITLSGVFIDDRSTNQEFHGFKVCSLEEICAKYEAFNVMVCFYRGYQMVDVLKSRCANIVNCYCCLDLGVVYGVEKISFDFIADNKELFEWTYENLSDELSREIYLAYLNARANAQYSELLPFVTEDQYFPNDIIKFSKDEVFVDCGAYDGSVVKAFVEHLDRDSATCSAIYALEPDNRNLLQLSNSLSLSLSLEKYVNYIA